MESRVGVLRSRMVKAIPSGCLVALTAYLVVYSWRFGAAVPYWDDFFVLPTFLEGDPPLFGWAFEAQSGHFAPLLKGAMILVLRASGGAFRVFPFVNIVLSAIGIWVLLRSLQRLFRPIETDILVPIVLFNLGFAYCNLRAILLNAGMHYLLLGCLLGTALLDPSGCRKRTRPILISGAVLLALTSGQGLVLAWFLVLALIAENRGWMGVSTSLTTYRVPVPYLAGAAALLAGFSALSLGGSGQSPAAASAGLVASVALQALGQSFGPVGAAGWTASGYGGLGIPVLSLFSLALLFGSASLLACNRTRLQAAGGLLFTVLGGLLCGYACLAAVVGATRSGLGPTFGLQLHYGMFFAHFLIVVYIVLRWVLPGRSSRLIGRLLLFVILASFTFNAQVGYRHGVEFGETVRRFVEDIRRGDPISSIAEKNSPGMYPDKERFEQYLRLMKTHHQYPFPRD